MTVTVRQLLSDAYLEIGIIRENEELSAEQLSTGIRKLNQMMADWHDDGIELGYYPQTVATANVPIPASAERAVTFNVAIEIAGSFGAPISPSTAKVANDSYRRLERDTIGLVEMSLDHLPGVRHNGYDILTDD